MKQKHGAYIAIGIALGTAVGVATDNLGAWLAIGIALGVAMAARAGKSEGED